MEKIHQQFFYRNNIIIPTIEIKAPIISLGRTFSLNTIMEKGIMITGDTDDIDETIPVAVYCTANKEKVIPRKGPKTEPTAISFKAFL